MEPLSYKKIVWLCHQLNFYSIHFTLCVRAYYLLLFKVRPPTYHVQSINFVGAGLAYCISPLNCWWVDTVVGKGMLTEPAWCSNKFLQFCTTYSTVILYRICKKTKLCVSIWTEMNYDLIQFCGCQMMDDESLHKAFRKLCLTVGLRKLSLYVRFLLKCNI